MRQKIWGLDRGSMAAGRTGTGKLLGGGAGKAEDACELLPSSGV